MPSRDKLPPLTMANAVADQAAAATSDLVIATPIVQPLNVETSFALISPSPSRLSNS